MQLVEGPTLANRIKAGPIPALKYAHEHGIIHRDRKPANVIGNAAGPGKGARFRTGEALTKHTMKGPREREAVMNFQPHDFEELRSRISKLESQNRRLKQLGGVVLIGIVLPLVMGQAPSKKTVEANEFVLRDSNAKARALLTIVNDNADLILYDATDKGRMELKVDSAGGASLNLFNAQGASIAALSGGDASVLQLGTTGGEERLLAAVAPGIVPSLILSDKDGFVTTIGGTDLITPKTGESRTTSAASVVMSDKQKNVIWKAP